MSWNMRLAASHADKDLLKTRVRAEHAPQHIKDEVCLRIDALPEDKGQIIYVETYGHEQQPFVADRRWHCVDDIRIRVWNTPFINTRA